MSQDKPTLFLLGATGYIGGQFLLQLKQEHDLKAQLNITALVRNPTQQRIAQLRQLWDNITVVEGDLDSDATIQEQCAKASYVVNAASSDHLKSVISILAGLESNSASRPNHPPLYIHLSGIAVFSDNSRGEHVPYDKIPKYTDTGFDINTCPPTNCHVNEDKLIVEAGTRKKNPIRSIILYPSWVYGLGESPMQRVTLPVRIFLSMYEKCGFAGTWGPGRSIVNNVHVKDLAGAMVLVFRAALEGRADEGTEGFYFVGSEAPSLTHNQTAGKMGDFMFQKGLVKQPGARPMPDDIADSLGHYGWSLFGGNQIVISERLKKLGWEATETHKKALWDSLSEEVEQHLRVVGKIA